MAGHFKVICDKCDQVINQCRCPSKDKTVTYKTCDECMKKATPPPKGT